MYKHNNSIIQALTSLGVCYFKGAGVEVNRVEAAELFRRAGLKGQLE